MSSHDCCNFIKYITYVDAAFSYNDFFDITQFRNLGLDLFLFCND
jgi:hypothetical protein